MRIYLSSFTNAPSKLSFHAGIAIGPILFVIALLAIIAAAIAAASTSFQASSSTENNRTESAALVQIGDQLKAGMDRLSVEGGYTAQTIDINASNTSANNALFSPAGGAITAPAAGMANNPTSDVWYYVSGPVNGIGTSASEIFATLRVSPGVCSEVNNRTTGIATSPAAADLGNFASQVTVSANTVTNWPPILAGHMVGCVNNSNAGSTGAYFYQIMLIQ